MTKGLDYSKSSRTGSDFGPVFFCTYVLVPQDYSATALPLAIPRCSARGRPSHTMQASRIVCDLRLDPKMRVDKAITNNDGSNIDEQEMRKIHEEVMAKNAN